MPKNPNVLLLFNWANQYERDLLRGIIQYSRLHGPWQFDLRNLAAKSVEPFLDLGFDGIIAPDLDNIKNVEMITKSGISSVLFDPSGPSAEHYNIFCHDQAIGELGAEHLLGRGFKHFAYCGYESLWWSQQRGEAFCRQIAQEGLNVICYDRPKSRRLFSQDEEEAYVADWLKTLPRPIGVMVCEDERARRIMEICKTNGIIVPDEIAVIGVGNGEILCELSNPPLSSIALNTEKSGYEVAELLDKLMAGKKPAQKNIIVEPIHVVTRRSTDTIAVKDEEVAKAIKFIRANANKPIHVDDVLMEVTCSRTELYRRFIRVFGHSVYEEIKRTRVKLFAQMLIETNHPIEHIAQLLDGPERKNIARWFNKIMGQSPRDYRKKFMTQ